MSLLKLQLKSPQTKDDLEQIVALDRLCLGGLWTLEGYQREVDSPNSLLVSLVLQGQIIGCGCFWAILEEAHITLLVVHPDYQGLKLGSLLLYTLLERAYQRGLERATLEVRESNTIALALYEKFGFKIAGRRKKYYKPDGEDALILWRGDLAKPDFLKSLDIWQAEFIHLVDEE
jgi:[ribosomal protein S18]-alanine N-acetyltransferase